MSRAFMKEGEPEEPRCPACGTLGDPVGSPTLKARLGAADLAGLGDKAYYCSNSACRTAYFNGWGASVPVERMSGSAWPKDPDGPACPCFGITTAEILADARAGSKERVKRFLERSQGPEARCVERSPDGRCCSPRLLQLFREHFQA